MFRSDTRKVCWKDGDDSHQGLVFREEFIGIERWSETRVSWEPGNSSLDIVRYNLTRTLFAREQYL